MILAIDIGNTHVVIGLFARTELKASWRLQSDRLRTVDEYALELLALLGSSQRKAKDITQVVICSVVPPLTRVFTKLASKYFSINPHVVHATDDLGIAIRVDDPRTVGPDRVVNALATKVLFGAPAIVVDFGTATTFDILSKDGAYEGGLISPGLVISASALFDRAAMLPNIELRRPSKLIGKNTVDAMMSGIIYGYVGLVDGILNRLLAAVGKETTIIATGGLASLIADESDHISQVVPELTLSGLRLIAERHAESRTKHALSAGVVTDD